MIPFVRVFGQFFFAANTEEAKEGSQEMITESNILSLWNLLQLLAFMFSDLINLIIIL